MVEFVNIGLSLVLIGIIIALYCRGKITWMISIICVFFCIRLDISILGLTFGSHYLLLPFLSAIVFLEWRKGNIYFSRPTLYFIIAWTSVLFIYIVAYLLRGNMDAWPEAGIKFVGILAYIIEAVLLVSLLQRLEDREKFNSFLYFILITAAINTMFVLLQLFFSSAGIPLTRLFVEGHILEGDIATGFFKRAHGIYFSPIILAAVTSFMFAVFAGYAIKKRKIPFHYYIAAILIGIIGLFSYTKTAVLGYPVLLVISIIVIFVQKDSMKSRFMQIGKLCLCVLLMFSAWYVITPPKNEYKREMYMGYLGQNFNRVFDTRIRDLVEDKEVDQELEQEVDQEVVGNTTGTTKSSLSVFKENPLIGVGPMSVAGEHIYDMMYISVLHNGGVLAFLILLIFYGGLAVYTFIKKKVVAFLIVCVFAFASLAGDALVYTALLPFFALALNLTENKGGKRYYLKPNAVRHELTDDKANT